MNEFSLDTDKLDSLRESFEEGQLEYVVGAGASIAAGLPGWNELNASMIEAYFNRAREEDAEPKVTSFDSEELRALSRVFADRFGKNAVIDLLRDDLSGQKFHQFLHDALYGGRKGYDLQPLHYELGAVVGRRLDEGNREKARLYTLNYDDILEGALEQITDGGTPTTVVEDDDAEPNSVVHLHGYMPLELEGGDPVVEGEIILSEKDYHRTRGGRPDERLVELLENPDADVVLLGTSLSDPRLRRLLYKRLEAREGDNGARSGRIWVFLTRSAPSTDAELATRRAQKMAENHVEPYWDSWDVEVIHIDNHEVLPVALRMIRLGEDVQEWLSCGVDFLEDNAELEGVYEEERQAKAQLKLIRSHDLIRQQFEVEFEEDLTLSFFIPVRLAEGDIELQPAFRFSDPHRRHSREGKWKAYPVHDADGISKLSSLVHGEDLHLRCLTEGEAEERRLEVPSLEEAEGATGFAVASGIVSDAADADSFFRNFDEEKRESWSDERTYSALLSIPIYDSTEWVPIGAACIASIKQVPFWESLDQAEQRNLERHMRSTFRNLLDYTSRF